MKKTLLIQSPAKINITLWVKEKRTDGYHEIASIMQTISLCDTIIIQEIKEEDIIIETNSKLVPTNHENLVHKAARLVYEKFNIKQSHMFKIQKNIPVAAGLAGGSSNAAATIVGLLRMYEIPITLPELLELGSKIGSDVPFLMHGGTAIATGRGEQLIFCDPPKSYYYVLLIIPKDILISTKWAYENYTPFSNERKNELFKNILPNYQNKNILELKKFLFNDLETVSFQRYPELQEIKDYLNNNYKCVALMSGSGPAIFALFDDKFGALQASQNIDRVKYNVFVEHTTRTWFR